MLILVARRREDAEKRERQDQQEQRIAKAARTEPAREPRHTGRDPGGGERKNHWPAREHHVFQKEPRLSPPGHRFADAFVLRIEQRQAGELEIPEDERLRARGEEDQRRREGRGAAAVYKSGERPPALHGNRVEKYGERERHENWSDGEPAPGREPGDARAWGEPGSRIAAKRFHVEQNGKHNEAGGEPRGSMSCRRCGDTVGRAGEAQ